jgi:hypothetical protein
MGRLFITQREINFINDIAKEVVKDVIGQKIYYFPISEIKSQVHDIYEETPEKIFDSPLEIECLVKYQAPEIRTNEFGFEKYYSIEAYIQIKDLLDKGITILEGDFFSYGTVFFEVIQAPATDIIMGQIEHGKFITVTGKQSRKSQFLAKVFGPKGEQYTDEDAVQNTFVQQRGFKENRLGETADVRELRKNGVLDEPITGPKEISRKGDTNSRGSSSFYGDE